MPIARLRIASEHIAGGFFRVLPDTNTDLAIEFNPYASLISPTGEVVRLNPALTVDIGSATFQGGDALAKHN